MSYSFCTMLHLKFLYLVLVSIWFFLMCGVEFHSFPVCRGPGSLLTIHHPVLGFFLPDPSIPPSPYRSLSPLITCPNARIDTQHKGVFQAAKWRYGLISLDVWSVFLTNSQISAREECQQGSAGWDKLRQVTTGGRREVCMWNYRNSMHSSQTYRVKIKHISAIKLQRGFARVCVRKGRGKVCGHLSLMMDRVWLESLSVSFCSTFCVCVCGNSWASY